jgi:hypothetical protein
MGGFKNINFNVNKLLKNNKNTILITLLLFILIVLVVVYIIKNYNRNSIEKFQTEKVLTAAEGENIFEISKDKGRPGIIKAYDFPKGITSIGEISRYNPHGSLKAGIKGGIIGNIDIKSIEIPKTVTKIGDTAFFFMPNLTDIRLPDNLSEIGNFAFMGCFGLTSVTIPEGVTYIGKYAFAQCDNLKKIIFENKNYTSITGFGSCGFTHDQQKLINKTIWKQNNKCTFYNQSNALFEVDDVQQTDNKYKDGLIQITIKDGVTKIDDNAFENCYNIDKIIIPESVTSIGNNAFKKCIFLKEININLSSIGEEGVPKFYNWGLTQDQIFINKIVNISIKDGVTRIADNAFKKWLGNTKITIPASVTSIGNNAFEGCSNLEEIIFRPNYMYSQLTSIGSSAFKKCINLKNVLIPVNVSDIGIAAFSGCQSLEFVQLYFCNVTKIKGNTFADCIELKSVTIPEKISHIDYGAFYGCRMLTSVIIRSKTIKIETNAFSNIAKEPKTARLNITFTNKELSTCNIDYKSWGIDKSKTTITLPDSCNKQWYKYKDGLTYNKNGKSKFEDSTYGLVDAKHNCNWVAEEPCNRSKRCDEFGYDNYFKYAWLTIGYGDRVQAKDKCFKSCKEC